MLSRYCPCLLGNRTARLQIDIILLSTLYCLLSYQSVHICLQLNLQLHDDETAGFVRSSSSEHGSSWAVEVGGHLKVCSIVVENLDKNGQMLVEVCLQIQNFVVGSIVLVIIE